MGAIAGLVIVGIAFIVPRIISQAVIEPVGGVALQSDIGLNCDSVLRSQMVFQRGASTEANMAVVIRQIQAQRQECPPDVWNPQVDDPVAAATPAQCWGGTSAAATGFAGTAGSAGKVGASQVPRGLRIGNVDTGLVRALSGRDSENQHHRVLEHGCQPSFGWGQVLALRGPSPDLVGKLLNLLSGGPWPRKSGARAHPDRVRPRVVARGGPCGLRRVHSVNVQGLSSG